MFSIISKLVGFLTGGPVASVAGGAINAAAILAVAAPAALWFLSHKDETAVTFSLTWVQLLVLGLLVAAVLKLVHYTRPPGQ